jgi:hypothetical protein
LIELGGDVASDPPAEVDAFFGSYREAFERFDVSAVADHFSYPVHTTSEAGKTPVISVSSREEWIGRVNQLLGAYQQIGVASAQAVSTTVLELSPRLYQAALRWALHSANGEVLYRFDAVYTLAKIDGSLTIAAVAHNELPRLQAWLARRQPA